MERRQYYPLSEALVRQLQPSVNALTNIQFLFPSIVTKHHQQSTSKTLRQLSNSRSPIYSPSTALIQSLIIPKVSSLATRFLTFPYTNGAQHPFDKMPASTTVTAMQKGRVEKAKSKKAKREAAQARAAVAREARFGKKAKTTPKK